ncbi:hypothetical protein KR059_002849 [Drosophila kikkawai]|nr:hypothetical protein KR059_002849 [Drosophila kikkawai]
MDEVHLAIGITGVVALIVIVANSVSCVSGRVAEYTGPSISDLVIRCSPVAHQLTGLEGEPSLVEGDGINATCSVVCCITGKAGAIVGPFLPRLPSLTQPNEEEKDADTKAEPEQASGASAPVQEVPPGEE